MDNQPDYVNIMEAAQRCGLADKTIRRAIAAHKLPAERLKSNKVRIAVSDLEAWHELATDERDKRIAELERRVEALEQQIKHLIQLPRQESGQQQETQPMPQLPDGRVYLFQFADQHKMPRNEAERLYKMGLIAGRREQGKGKSKGRVIINDDGKWEFWVQFHEHPGFWTCDGCPHLKD